MQTLASETIAKMRAALDDDLNTAQAQAAIFEMVRQGNTALDSGALKKDDAAALLHALKKFDEIFAVLEDDDVPKMKKVLQWAQAEGREHDITDSLREALQSGQLSDRDIESKVNEMKAARTARDFKKSDAIRAELTEAGVLIEITKDGIRWRRK
jgi:cysteinyl-tRNA synthetase